MERWELLSETAALVRPHFFAHTVIVLPALVATYAVNSLAMSYKVDMFALRDHPLQTFLVVSAIRFVQFFLGWLFVAFEFAVILQFLQQEEKGARGIGEAVGSARSSFFQITLLSWAIYWRSFLLMIPIVFFVSYCFTSVIRLYRFISPIWSGQIQTLIMFSVLALVGSKWLLAFPEVVLGSLDARGALRKASKELESLHENLLVLSLLFLFVLLFATTTWPELLRYVYIPANWPEPAIEAIQKWLVPATSLIFDTWATLMLFVGTFVLWKFGQDQQAEMAVHADPLA